MNGLQGLNNCPDETKSVDFSAASLVVHGGSRASPTTPTRNFPFQAWVDTDRIPAVSASPTKSKKNKAHSKTADELRALVTHHRAKELKVIVREGAWSPCDNVRTSLWQDLISLHTTDKQINDHFYWDTVKQIYGANDFTTDTGQLPTFVEASFQFSYYLNRMGIQMARRVVNVISYSYPDITYAPSLYPLACILLHYMGEEECYTCLSWMLSSKRTKFITQTKLHYETIWRTAMLLSRKHAKSAVSYIGKQVGDNSAVEMIHQNWLKFIFKHLPFQHLVRVLDCFFFEGRKVIYRVWMAILVQFYRHSIAISNSSLNKEAGALGMETAIANFCKDIPCGPEKLLKAAFSIRNFRSVEMDRLFIKTEMYLKSRQTAAGSAPTPAAHSLGPRSRSSDVLPTSQSQINVQMMSHTLTIREGARSPDPRPRSLGLYPIHGVRSVAADFDCLLTVWSWLPVRITMYQPILLYTTEEHGCSLTTFFGRVEQHEPTIMIIKTVSGEVFGAYLSTRWAERKAKGEFGGRQAYFGTGESFIFTLSPERVKYPWVGISVTSSSDGPACVRHAAELFMASDGHMLTIGGGGKGQAIWIDENIRYGKTERCLTFNNPPLCSAGDFEIRVMEVYGFAGF